MASDCLHRGLTLGGRSEALTQAGPHGLTDRAHGQGCARRNLRRHGMRLDSEGLERGEAIKQAQGQGFFTLDALDPCRAGRGLVADQRGRGG